MRSCCYSNVCLLNDFYSNYAIIITELTQHVDLVYSMFYDFVIPVCLHILQNVVTFVCKTHNTSGPLPFKGKTCLHFET